MHLDLNLEWQSTLRVQRNDAARMVFPIRAMYLDAIERAERYVYLTNAYFIPDRAILEALVLTARRGVDVRILVPADRTMCWPIGWPGIILNFVKKIGIRIFTYQGTIIHAKTATIDGIWSTVGTANLDRLSLAGNHKINLEIYNAAVAGQMEAIFNCDLTNAHEVVLTEWIDRPWYTKAAELVLSPWSASLLGVGMSIGRPFLITLLAVGYIVSAALDILVGLGLFGNNPLPNVISGSNTRIVLIGGLQLMFGLALFKGARWAWWLVIIGAYIPIITHVIGGLSGDSWAWGTILWNVIVLAYLLLLPA